MAITATLTVDNPTPAHGDMITATYAVFGNDGTPAQAGSVTGSTDVGGQVIDVLTTLTFPAVDPLPVTYAKPVTPGLTWVATANPAVWTAVVP